MALRLSILGQVLRNISSYSVSEDSTPLDISDSSGGYGQVTLTVASRPGWRSWRKKLVDFEDTTQGTTQAIVTTVSEDHTTGMVSVSADSRVSAMAAVRTAQPYVGTLGGALRYYLSLVGITSQVVIDSVLEDRAVTFQGWEGEVYFYLTKKLAPALGFEVSLVSDNIVFRLPRGRKAVTYRDSGLSESLDAGDTAQNVIVHYYENTAKNNALVYPTGGWNEDVEVYIVEAGATLVVEDVPLGVSVSRIVQPVCVMNVERGYEATSVYAVAGNDGLPITPEQWAAGGGSLKVEINPDTKSLKLTVVASNLTEYAPYRIAMSAGDSDYYSSLRIVGDGVFFTDKSIIMPTGLSSDDAPTETGAEIENEYIGSIAEAFDAGIRPVGRYSGFSHSISVASSGINRVDDNGNYSYPTIAQFNIANAGRTIAQHNAIWAGQTIADFNDYWNETVSDDFANQAFGNIAGARRLFGQSYFRIRSATNSVGEISYTAEADTTLADFNARWSGHSIEDFNTIWSGLTIEDFNAGPLEAGDFMSENLS